MSWRLYLDDALGMVHIDAECPVRQETQTVGSQGLPTQGFALCGHCMETVQQWHAAHAAISATSQAEPENTP